MSLYELELIGGRPGKAFTPDASDPYRTVEIVELRRMRGASLCIDERCNLSGGYAHAGPCEPCSCPLRHAAHECPAYVGAN